MKIEDLFEIGDTKVDVNWERNGRFELSSFNLNGFTYIIQIESKPLPYPGLESLKSKNTAEVSFFLQNPPEGYSEFDNINQFKHSSLKIFSIVLNALSPKFDDYDAFMFTAKTKHSSSPEEYKTKKRLYSNLADRVAKIHGLFKYERSIEGGQGFLVSKIKVDINEGWKNPVLKWISQQDFSKSPTIG